MTEILEDLPGEEWKPLQGTNYDISNFGRLRYKNRSGAYRTSKAKSFTTKSGYIRVHLSNKGNEKNIFLHKEVLQAFVPQPCNNCFAKHINGDKSDNRLSNLAWQPRKGTQFVNNKLKTIEYLSVNGSIKKKRSKISIGDVQRIHQLYSNGLSQIQLAGLYNISQSYISLLLKCGIRLLSGRAILYRKSQHELYIKNTNN